MWEIMHTFRSWDFQDIICQKITQICSRWFKL